MKIALLNDTHYGWKNDLHIYLDFNKRFFDKVFFPYIDKHKIQVIGHLGDLFERRKYINFYTAHRARIDLLNKLRDRQLDIFIIAGNHDIYYRETNKVSALNELLGEYDFKIFTECSEITIDGERIILVPWINRENAESTFKMIQKSKAKICLGHLELNGFEMHRGHVQEHGTPRKVFDKFDFVASGHYHHKQSLGNIHYLGSQLQLDWSDYKDVKGFHVFDTETYQLDFIRNEHEIFKKIFYDDTKEMPSLENCSDSYIKVIVQEKTNPMLFDQFITKLQSKGVSNLHIVEDHHNFDSIDNEELLSETEDTLSVFHKYIDNMDNENIDKNSLKRFVTDLYTEAVNLE